MRKVIDLDYVCSQPFEGWDIYVYCRREANSIRRIYYAHIRNGKYFATWRYAFRNKGSNTFRVGSLCSKGVVFKHNGFKEVLFENGIAEKAIPFTWQE